MGSMSIDKYMRYIFVWPRGVHVRVLFQARYSASSRTHDIKDIFFFVCLFFLLTITGRNEAIIVELKELFVLNGTFITRAGGSHH